MMHGRSTRGLLARMTLLAGVSMGSGASAFADATSLSFREPPAPPASPTVPAAPTPSDQAARTGAPDAAQPTVCPPIPPQADEALHVMIDPMIWFVGPSGKFSLPVN